MYKYVTVVSPIVGGQRVASTGVLEAAAGRKEDAENGMGQSHKQEEQFLRVKRTKQERRHLS